MFETVKKFGRTSATGAALAVAALALVACNSTGNGGSTGGTASKAKTDHDGDEPIAGEVRIVRVDRSELATTGTVRYVLENTSGKLQEDLSYYILFHYPPTGSGAIEVQEDSESSQVVDLVLFPGDKAKEVSAVNPRQGVKVVGTKLEVEKYVAVPAVARSADLGRGTLFLNGALECVAMSADDARYETPPSLWIEFENVSRTPVQLAEAKVVFYDHRTDTKVSETSWQPIRDLPPAQRARIDFNLSGLQGVRGSFLVKVRPQQVF